MTKNHAATRHGVEGDGQVGVARQGAVHRGGRVSVCLGLLGLLLLLVLLVLLLPLLGLVRLVRLLGFLGLLLFRDKM